MLWRRDDSVRSKWLLPRSHRRFVSICRALLGCVPVSWERQRRRMLLYKMNMQIISLEFINQGLLLLLLVLLWEGRADGRRQSVDSISIENHSEMPQLAGPKANTQCQCRPSRNPVVWLFLHNLFLFSIFTFWILPTSSWVFTLMLLECLSYPW